MTVSRTHLADEHAGPALRGYLIKRSLSARHSRLKQEIPGHAMAWDVWNVTARGRAVARPPHEGQDPREPADRGHKLRGRLLARTS